MEINKNQENIISLKRNKQIGLVGGVVCIIIFFMLIKSTEIQGLMLISYPILLGLGIFFGTIGSTGKVKDGIKYLSFILALVLLIVVIGLLLR